MKVMISACLLGVNCKYNGGNNFTQEIVDFASRPDVEVTRICPETMGGLAHPRVPSEIGPDGKVYSRDGDSVDAEFRLGAEKCLELARRTEPDLVILKAKSPSCGVGQVYDGTFSGTLIPGNGVTAGVLLDAGYRVMTDLEFLERLACGAFED